MNLLIRLLGFFTALPFRLKGGSLGPGSLIGPGYRLLGVSFRNITIGKNCLIGNNAWIQTIGRGKITLGDGVSLGRDVVLSAAKEIYIGKKTLFSYRVSVLDHNHAFSDPTIPPMDQGLTDGKAVTIGDHCFIGANSFILPGVTLGKHTIVGANSVVTKPFPSNCVIAGNPAKIIKKLVKPRAHHPRA